MKINHANQTIEMSRAYAKAAGILDSAEYKELNRVRKEFPEYEIVVRATKSKRTSFKGMDLEFMTDYISAHENAEENLAKFNKLVDKKLCYGELKQWFVSNYPIFKDCKTRADWILAA